jgi:hypothetical protein
MKIRGRGIFVASIAGLHYGLSPETMRREILAPLLPAAFVLLYPCIDHGRRKAMKLKSWSDRWRPDSDGHTERQRAEYNGFGPWTFPVRAPEEMPPRFDPWYDEIKDSSLILKIPRDIERRSTRAGEDLYEGVLAVGKRGIVYLDATGSETRKRGVAFGEIAAIRRALELLSGELRFDLAGGEDLSVRFNAVSAPVIDYFVDLVRSGCADAGSGLRFTPIEGSRGPSEENVLFQNLLRELRQRNPGLALAAYQPPCALAARRGEGRRGLAGAAARLLRWHLDGSLLAVLPQELLVLVNGTGAPRTRKTRGYRYEAVYIPSASFRGPVVESRTLANGARVHVLRLSCAGHDYELLFELDPSAALASLSLPRAAG